jgi:asparagine synthase (glutamine-hydrolysing)
VANWLLVIDGDTTRRQACASHARASAAPLPGLMPGSCSGPWWDVVWAAGPRAPVTWAADTAGGGVLVGDALGDGGVRQDAASLRRAWRDGHCAQWDGFYAGIVVDDAARTATVAADVLGTFPVYWWTADGVTLAGTSPELFRAHPSFRPSLDVEGLVGILLTNGLVDGRTLWQDVRRLAPGACLRVGASRVVEDRVYSLPLGLGAVDLPLDGHVRQMAAAVDDAVRRHVPPARPVGVLLSGGIDSRQLAGALHAHGHEARALTFGRADDIEMICARGVARELGFPHESADLAAAAFPEAADRLARWEMLAAGFAGVPEWTMHGALGRLPDRVVMGHLLDAVVGGSHVAWAYDPATGTMGFDALWAHVTAWGFSGTALEALLGTAYRGLPRAVAEDVRRRYDAAADLPHHRAWCFDLAHRQRFHVGSALWVASFASWPVVPALDREVMRAAAALPGSSLANRRAQTGALVAAYPRLAGLPLDRNSYDRRPLTPRLRDEAAQFAADRWNDLRRGAARWTRRPARERRYYRRLYDLDGPGWQAVRRHAEPWRSSLPGALSSRVVASAWPGADIDLALADPIREASPVKLLMGLAVWCGRSGGCAQA